MIALVILRHYFRKDHALDKKRKPDFWQTHETKLIGGICGTVILLVVAFFISCCYKKAYKRHRNMRLTKSERLESLKETTNEIMDKGTDDYILPNDPPQKTFSECQTSSKNSASKPHETYDSQYAEIKDDFFDNNLDSRQSYSVSCNQIGSRTSNAPATLKCIAPYAKLEVVVPSIYAQLNQTDAERLTLRSSLNANPDKGSLVTQSYLEKQETSQQSVYENTK